MAALNRPTNATYEVHENVTIDTQDNEDHTFCGIMFPVKCKNLLPVDHLVIKSVSVRGRLGPLTVWVSNEDQSRPAGGGGGGGGGGTHRRRGGRHATLRNTNNNNNNNDRQVGGNGNGGPTTGHQFQLHKRYWTKVYDKTHAASKRSYKELVLDTPIRLRPGQTRCLYIHSTLPGDEAIVYDNSYYGNTGTRYEDDKLVIMTGRAHVSTSVFGQDPIWGWGNAWRDRREFVGRLDYGTVYKLWNPEVQPQFGSNFQNGARTLFLCQRRWESPWSILPDECIYYILNMCRWDWFHDTASTMKERRRREKARNQQLALAQMQQEEEDRRQRSSRELAASVAHAAAAAVPMDDDGEDEEEEDSKPCAVSSRTRSRLRIQDDDDDDDDDDDNESGVQLDDDDEDEDVEMDNDEEDDEDDEEEDEDDDEDGSDAGVWSDDDDQYHSANPQQFHFEDVSSDDEETNAGELQETRAASRQDWIRRQFARIHVLRALASMEDQAVAHVDR